jgi:transcriptional regulator with XRE-family HTH domain
VEAQQSAGRFLRELRQAQKRSLRSTASELGLAPSHLSRLERGERSPSAEMSQRIADYYGVPGEAIELADGRIPPDIIKILSEHPEELDRLRRLYISPSDERSK